MTFFTNSKKYAKKIKKAEKCVVYENTVRELFSCEQFKKGAEAHHKWPWTSGRFIE